MLDIEGGADDGKIIVYFQRAGSRKLVAQRSQLTAAKEPPEPLVRLGR